MFCFRSGQNKTALQEILEQFGIAWEEGTHSPEKIAGAAIVIKSPGIPDKAQIIQEVKRYNIPVVSEIEFAGRYTDAIKICITGSNGKTTTTMLTYEILRRAGLNVGLAGNVGKSFAWQVAEEKFNFFVIELSSFQLDDMYDFKADIAVLLNITPDHLDRYNYDMQNYVNAKFRILQNQTEKDYFIYCGDDPVIIEEMSKRIIKPAILPFSLNPVSENGAGVTDENINIHINEKNSACQSWI
jgi:UDP-N-acetylmuramoylalanine--D-glutamate ligase